MLRSSFLCYRLYLRMDAVHTVQCVNTTIAVFHLSERHKYDEFWIIVLALEEGFPVPSLVPRLQTV